MLTIDPEDVSVSQFHRYLLGAVSPRPIAFASTVDANGQVNLSPFSFFNCFGAHPPLLIFSPARRGTDNRIHGARQKGIEAVHRLAQEYLQNGKVAEAWALLLGGRST